MCEGAAIYAGMLSGVDPNFFRRLLMMDAVPFSLGVRDGDGNVVIAIPRNTSMPCERSLIFSTAQDGQTAVTVEIVEVEERSWSTLDYDENQNCGSTHHETNRTLDEDHIEKGSETSMAKIERFSSANQSHFTDYTDGDNQDCIDEVDCPDVYLLGTFNFNVHGGSKAKAGEKQIKVKFGVSIDGVLTVDSETIGHEGDKETIESRAWLYLLFYLLFMVGIYVAVKTVFGEDILRMKGDMGTYKLE